MNRVLVSALLLATTACMQEKGTPEDYTERIERSSVSAEDTASPPARVADHIADPPPVLPGSLRTAAVVLRARTAPAPHGAATLRGNGGTTIVDVRLRGERNGGTYSGGLHRGSCERLGAQVAGVNPVSTDTSGNGRSATIVALPIDTLLAHSHALVFGIGGRPESCGNVGTG